MLEDTVPATRLEEPLPLSKILNCHSEFSVKVDNEEDEETDITKVYSYDSLLPYALKETLEVVSDDNENTVVDDISNAFPFFRKQMTNVTEDGKIMKKIEKFGAGNPIPDNGRVWFAYIHYSAYVEFGEFPFDISYLRSKKPMKVLIGTGDIIEGLEIAIRSMTVGEKSKFIIHPDLAFQEKGVPPRIPPQATLLLDVELIDFCQDEKIAETPLPLTFEEKIMKAKRMCEKGNRIKKIENNYSDAISNYRRGIMLLVSSKYTNSEEEKIAKSELLRLYTNLAVCYLLKKDYKRTCNVFNDALTDCSDLVYTNIKILYASSKALRFMGDFEEALKRLRIALTLQEGNADILKELKALEIAIDRNRNAEIKACRKMFGFMSVNKSDVNDETVNEILNAVDNKFKQEFDGILDDFTQAEVNRIVLEDCFVKSELDYINCICEKRKIEVRIIRLESSEVSRVTLVKHMD